MRIMEKYYHKKPIKRGLTVSMALESHYQKNQDIIRQQRKRNWLIKSRFQLMYEKILKFYNNQIVVSNGQFSPKPINSGQRKPL